MLTAASADVLFDLLANTVLALPELMRVLLLLAFAPDNFTALIALSEADAHPGYWRRWHHQRV